jgi:DNA-binding NarL/FixJ family response regulator
LKPSPRNASVRNPAASLESIRVAIVIAAKLERLGWSIVVDSQEDMEVVGQFSSFSPALAFIASHSVDVAVIDDMVLTPAACEALEKLTHRRLPHLLMMARHRVDTNSDPSVHSLVSRRLLKGLSAAELLVAIRDTARSGLPADAGRELPSH